LKGTQDEPFSGLVFKIMNDPFVGQLSYMRIYSGQLKAGETVWGAFCSATGWPSLSRCRRVFVACPRLALHGLHDPTRLLRSLLPPSATLCTWSASVAGALWHQ